MQNKPPQKRTLSTKDLILIALAVFVIFIIDWKNMNSFHYLILFLLLLCFMLRWSNMRKEAQKEAITRRKEMEEATRLIENTLETAADSDLSTEPTAEDAPAENTSAKEKTE